MILRLLYIFIYLRLLSDVNNMSYIITFLKVLIFNLIALLIKINNFESFKSYIYKKIITNALYKMN